TTVHGVKDGHYFIFAFLDSSDLKPYTQKGVEPSCPKMQRGWGCTNRCYRVRGCNHSTHLLTVLSIKWLLAMIRIQGVAWEHPLAPGIKLECGGSTIGMFLFSNIL
ncbi:unnamed protein product, partial [Meganyctiphanes norvegica]